MEQPAPPAENNTLVNASLWLGIASAALVFGIGLCAVTTAPQTWLPAGGLLLFICGASSAFLGFIAMILGGIGMFNSKSLRATAIAGLVLGLIAICLFIIALAAVGG